MLRETREGKTVSLKLYKNEKKNAFCIDRLFTVVTKIGDIVPRGYTFLN
jgi:hypothetical protein